MKKYTLSGSGCLFACAMLMVVTVSGAGTHQFNVGPREAFYISEDNQYKEFTTGLTLGYQYSLLAADMFRLKFGSDNSIDIANNRFGVYLSPGLFFQTDKGQIGAFTRQRFHTGVTSYDDGSIEHLSKMFVWGIQGGFVTGKISHTIMLESSRFVSRLKSSNVWPDWNKIPPERRFSYTIGINVPSVLKMEKTGEHTSLH